jgi:hypothetical protein
MSELTTERKEEFLEELTKLSRKHKIVIRIEPYDGYLLPLDNDGHYIETAEGTFWHCEPEPCPDGYKLVTEEEMKKYKKPETPTIYLFRLRNRSPRKDKWRRSSSTDGLWRPDVGDYAVPVDHIWEEVGG